MGMDADVIGIGPITQEILRTGGLDYDDDVYKDMPVGTTITCSFFRCVMTLADAMTHEDEERKAKEAQEKAKKKSDIKAKVNMYRQIESYGAAYALKTQIFKLIDEL